MTRKVDVIILSWNRVADTIAAIESALSQQGVSVRVQVVDQGSTLENLGRLKKAIAAWPNVTLKELGLNVGVARGRNIATRMGMAPYVVALDNDAVFPDTQLPIPSCLTRTPELLEWRKQLMDQSRGRHSFPVFILSSHRTSITDPWWRHRLGRWPFRKTCRRLARSFDWNQSRRLSSANSLGRVVASATDQWRSRRTYGRCR